MNADRLDARHAHTYGAHAARYAVANEDRSFAEPLLARLSGALAPGSWIIDLGCGPGWESEALERRGMHVVGVDLVRRFLMLARREHPASGYVEGDFLALPFREAALSGAWACSALVHVPRESISIALAEVARVLESGGAFLATMQAGSTEGLVLSTSIPGASFHYTFYEPEEWGEYLQGAGFDIAWLDYQKTEPQHCNPGGHGWISSVAIRR